MDHVNVMLKSNLDDLVSSQIGAHRGILATLANDICLIGLCSRNFISMRLYLKDLIVSYSACAC
jgi:hypothetical protein